MLFRRPLVLAVVVSLVTSVVVGAGTFALANHRWPDVATGNGFHNDVTAFSSAGCGTGFPDNTFRPKNTVNRQQVARFLRACGARVANSDSNASVSVAVTPTGTTLRSTQVTAGAQGTGGGFVLAIATVELTQTTATLPCTVLASLTSPQRPGQSETASAIWATAATGGESVHVTMTQLWEIGAGETITARVGAVKLFDCSSLSNAVRAEGEVTALYVPFDGSGLGSGT